MTTSRRRFLRGAGAAIALPLVVGAEGQARAAVPPERLITVFWGQGMPPAFTAEGYAGSVFAPLAKHQAKLALVRGLTATAFCPDTDHNAGCASFACGMSTDNAYTKGGPSLDWVGYQSFGARTPLPTLSAGLYRADNSRARVRIVQSWRGVGQPNEPIPDVLHVFQALFGNVSGAPAAVASPGITDEAARRARRRVSVLDAVLQDYRAVTGERSPSGRQTRALISDHAQLVRELEMRAVALTSTTATPITTGCKPGAAPASFNTVMTPEVPKWDAVWPVLADLYVTGLRCDLFRFGNMMLMSGGDKFAWPGREGNVHDHAFHAASGNDFSREVLRWSMTKISDFLTRLDDPRFPDVDGKTLLDNATVVIGTEIGEPGPHRKTDMPFFVNSSRGRFKPGEYDHKGRSDVDFYRTVCKGIGITRAFGDSAKFQGLLPII